MKLLVALALLGVVGSVVGRQFVAPIELDYHNKIGVPLAARIKAAEEALDFDGARIAGGSAAGLGQYPFIGGLIILLVDGRTSMCGSTLLTNTRAVTAAHCWRGMFSDAQLFTVVLGSTQLYSGGTRIPTADVELHADYDIATIANDIAMITLPWVAFNQNIHNIGIYSRADQLAGTSAWAAGYGITEDPTTYQSLNHVQVEVITNAECQQHFNPIFVMNSTLCISGTGGRNICDGDSGGPLVANNQLIGITSWGHGAGCAAGFPSGFARVSFYANWIWDRLGTSTPLV